jgi:glycine betaine/choline ABC-type transport system substrate-binding protein/ABC-type proline/glycine betaine transport system permease subunit
VEAGDVIDALDDIFPSRESLAGGTRVGGSELTPLLWTHLRVTFTALLVAILLAVPIAVWLGHIGRGRLAASTLANVGRALPTFAVLVFTSTYIGLNTGNLVFALVLLAIPPIFTNTYVAIRQVDPETVDAARGLGLTGMQVVRRVELPLALPLMFGGIRTSAVNVAATATLGPFVGVSTLGDPIINSNVYGDAGRLGGSILVAAVAFGFEIAFAALQRGVTPAGLKSHHNRGKHPMKIRLITSSLLAALVFGVAACGSDDDNGSSSTAATATTTDDSGKVIARDPANASKPQITLGTKNFTEALVVGEVYAQALEAAGFKIKRQFNLGSEQIAFKALKAGKIDGYPEYTGTALTSFFKVKPKDVTTDAQAAYEEAKGDYAKIGITALPPTPFTDSNGFAVTQATAKKLGLKTLSDLSGKSSKLTVSGGPECRQREDCLLGLEKVYGLKFKKFLSIDLAKRHEVITKGQSDVGLVFTTDGQIAADKLVLLEDDKKLFPPYNLILTLKDATAQELGAEGRAVIERVQEGLTTPVMQELNSRVDLDKEKPAAVAGEYLKEAGYLK